MQLNKMLLLQVKRAQSYLQFNWCMRALTKVKDVGDGVLGQPVDAVVPRRRPSASASCDAWTLLTHWFSAINGKVIVWYPTTRPSLSISQSFYSYNNVPQGTDCPNTHLPAISSAIKTSLSARLDRSCVGRCSSCWHGTRSCGSHNSTGSSENRPVIVVRIRWRQLHLSHIHTPSLLFYYYFS